MSTEREPSAVPAREPESMDWESEDALSIAISSDTVSADGESELADTASIVTIRSESMDSESLTAAAAAAKERRRRKPVNATESADAIQPADPTDVETVQKHTNMLLNRSPDMCENMKCLQYKATRRDLVRRYIVFALAGISFLMPYHCFSLSTPYVVSKLFATANSTNSTANFTSTVDDCKIDSVYLQETWPTIVIWILQLSGLLTTLVIHWYATLKQAVVLVINGNNGVVASREFFYRGTGERGHMFRAVIFGAIEVGLLIISVLFFNYIKRSCYPVAVMVGILFLACLLAITANVVQMSVLATTAMFGKYNINAFTIGLDLGGCLVATTAFVYALTTQSQDVLAFFMQSVILVAFFVVFAVCFARSKDYSMKMVEFDQKSSFDSKRRAGDFRRLGNGQCVLVESGPKPACSGPNPFLIIQLLLFWQTFAVFPGIFLSVMPYDESKIVWWYSLSVFLNFSVWALFFSVAAPSIYKKIFLNRSSSCLLTGSLSVVLFVRMIIISVLYLGTNYKPEKPRPTWLMDPFIGDWTYALLISAFAISHSCVASLTDIAIGHECTRKIRSKVRKEGGKLVLVRNIAICLGLITNLVLNKIY